MRNESGGGDFVNGLFKAVGVALPPLVRQVPTGTPPPRPMAPPQPPRRRGRPRRGATLL